MRPIRAVQLSATWTFGRPKKKEDDVIDLPSGGNQGNVVTSQSP